MDSQTNQMTGGQVISAILRGYGIETAFVLAGAAHAHTLYALEDDGVAVISGRHETGTVGAADGYARVTGRPGIAMIAGKQGMPNAMGAIQTARLACSPVVVFASVYPDDAIESSGEEGQDALRMAEPFAKWCKVVPRADRLAEYVHAAIRAAMSGRPGVSVIGVPGSIQRALIEVPQALSPAQSELPKGAAKDEDVAAAAEMISQAKRPLVLAGSGAALSGAGEALRRLVANHKVPVFGHALGRGLVPEDMQFGFSWPLAQIAAQKADAVIAVGIRLAQRLGYGLAPRFGTEAQFCQIDIDPSEFSRNRVIDVPLFGDAALTVAKLDAALADRGYTPPAATPTWVNAALSARLARIEELGTDEAAPIHPLRVGRELSAAMPQNAIFVGDGADALNWMHGVMRMRGDRCYLDHYPLGSMGIGTALAIGAAAGERESARQQGRDERIVVLVTGDGSFGFYATEWNAVALANLKIVCVILNDRAWGTEKNGQLHAMGRNVNCELGDVAYEAIAKAFGVHGERIESNGEIADALQRAFASDTATVLNILTDPDAGLARKQDPLLQMISFEDLRSSQKAQLVT